jgi:threonine synthase
MSKRMNISWLQCVECGTMYPIDEIRFSCSCGHLLDVVHDLGVLKPMVSRELFDDRLGSIDPPMSSGVWRFRELIMPEVTDEAIVTKAEGNTRIYKNRKISAWTGIDNLFLKHEGENPTGSFKDRGMTVAVTKAKALERRAVVCASTGNTSASLASYASEGGMVGIVLIPHGDVAFGKVAQALAYGAKTLMVRGDFDDCMRLIQEAEASLKAYPLNSINPFRLEGQKTIMWETLQQLHWDVPDWIVLPGGNLGNTSAFGKAFYEAKELGLIDRLPRFAVIQAAGANPFYSAFKRNFDSLQTVKAATIATAIKIGNPVNYEKAIRTLRWTNGISEQVSDEEILDAKAIVDASGIGAEPASCATVAGVQKLVANGVIKKSETVVGLLTGHVLKDPDAIAKYHDREPNHRYSNPPRQINPSLDELAAVLNE